jgi:hypothetical protein
VSAASADVPSALSASENNLHTESINLAALRRLTRSLSARGSPPRHVFLGGSANNSPESLIGKEQEWEPSYLWDYSLL